MAHAWNGYSQSLSIPAAGQKDRRLWERECTQLCKTPRSWNTDSVPDHNNAFSNAFSKLKRPKNTDDNGFESKRIVLKIFRQWAG